MRTTPVVVVALSLALVGAGCSGGSESVENTTGTTAGGTATAVVGTDGANADDDSSPFVTTPPVEIIRQPLTGEPVDSDADILSRPALAVKIDNHPDARQNQNGLAVADIVFEEIVEGGQTRFVAVFHSRDSDPLGPIRSSRSQDIALLAPLNMALFATSGANAGVNKLIAEAPVVDLSAQQGTEVYYRGPGANPHNLYSDTESLWALTPEDHPGPPPQQFEYLLPDATFVGEQTVGGFGVSIGDLRVEWRWDSGTRTWQRSQAGDVHLDAAHGPVAATNVVVMLVAYGRSAIDVNSPEARTVGDGLTLIFSDGRAVVGRWERSSEDTPFSLFDQNDELVALTPGNTWIELVAGDPENPVAPVDFFPQI